MAQFGALHQLKKQNFLEEALVTMEEELIQTPAVVIHHRNDCFFLKLKTYIDTI